MKKMNQIVPTKLKNKYSNEFVMCDNMKDIVEDENYKFIKVYKQEQPHRVYLVNKDAYEVVKLK